MAIGFDYGTANCSVAHIVDGTAELIPLINKETYIPSTLSAPNAESVSEYLFRCKDIRPADDSGEAVLRRAIKTNRDEGLIIRPDDVLFGEQALDMYLEDPKEVYYIKSPKSFLGAKGLRDMQLSFFEDLVCAMMINIKNKAECTLERTINDTVIGRPINFLGRGGEDSNRQAESILYKAAQRAGFKGIEFQFEPVAAGLEYESSLTSDKNVLVVDIGGGTTDCSLIQMGPSWKGKLERKDSLLSSTGQLVGGNDLDIYIAFKHFMSEFGKGTKRKNGLDIPLPQFWNPLAINDVQAQRKFYNDENLTELKSLSKQATCPEKVSRLETVNQHSLGYLLVKEAEKAKIKLSDYPEYHALIDLHTEQLDIPISWEQMEEAIQAPTQKIKALVKEAVNQSGTRPDLIFMTGGSARSAILRDAVSSVLPNIPIVSGSYFGSVTSGLARWADLYFT